MRVRYSKTLQQKTYLFLPFTVANLRFPLNSVVNTKLPAILSHRRNITVSLETYPFYKEPTC